MTKLRSFLRPSRPIPSSLGLWHRTLWILAFSFGVPLASTPAHAQKTVSPKTPASPNLPKPPAPTPASEKASSPDTPPVPAPPTTNFPAARTPFPGGELFRVPTAPAAWKIAVQRPQGSGKSNRTKSTDSFLSAEVVITPEMTREALAFTSGRSIEKWRVGRDQFRYSPSEQIVTRESNGAGIEPLPVGASHESTSWSDMQELRWLTKENFWFRQETPSGPLLIFIEDEEAFHPEPDPLPVPADPQGAPNIPTQPTPPQKTPPAPTTTAPSAPRPPADDSSAETSPPPTAPGGTKILSSDPNADPLPPQDATAEPKISGGKILPYTPGLPYGLIPGVQLKPSVRAAAIDANTRQPRVVQIGVDSFVYSYLPSPAAPPIPDIIRPMVRRNDPPAQSPGSSPSGPSPALVP